MAHGFGYSILNQRPAHELTYGGRAVATTNSPTVHRHSELVLANLSGVKVTNRASAFRELCKRHFTATERGTRGAGR